MGGGGGRQSFRVFFFSNTERGAQKASDMQFSHCVPPLPVINDQSLIYENHFVIACWNRIWTYFVIFQNGCRF